jgi:hypothetical protein
MRLWSIHPRHLDPWGLVALWREALLAQKVLLGKTRGYTRHPQLTRFKNTRNPTGAIAAYLVSIADEADRRKYNFDRSKIGKENFSKRIPVTSGQIEYEIRHLASKLKERAPARYTFFQEEKHVDLHPLFKMVEGDVEPWEKKKGA